MKYRITILSLCLVSALLLPAAAAAMSLTGGGQDNAPPIAENLTLTTYKNVAVQGRCSAVDPEGDLITFRLVDKPARGQVELLEDGTFCYTPYENKKGKDSFSYVAVDANGSVSAEAVVKVTIEKQSTAVSYSDMEGSSAHYAAIRLAEDGIFTGTITGGVYRFSPDETVTRSEFLTMAMAAAGAEALEDVTVTGFYDDGDIPSWAKGYVSAALLSGTVQGSTNSEGRVVFSADSPITAAEAAVIIDRLLAMGDVSGQGNELAPAWASQAVMNMEAVDVVSSDSDLTAPLTRAEAAEMLSAMLDVMENRAEASWFF